ncbi:hypothetical protein D3C78_1497710 [compost metagenome]
MLLRQIGQDGAQRADVGFHDVQRGAHLQHVGGVHDVLGGRAPVHITAGVAAHLHQLVHQRQDGVTDDVGLVAHMIEIDLLYARHARNRLRRVVRNHAAAGLGARQRHFDFDIAGDERAIGEDFAHRGRAERIAKQDGIDDSAGRGAVEHGSAIQYVD